jgi:hypothetical protein
MSDSLTVEATGEGKDRLAQVLSICISWKNVEPTWQSWKKTKAGGIVFSRHSNQNGFTDFPAPVGPVEAAATACAVLSCIDIKKWPPKPDIDGSVHRGWRVKQDFYGVTVEPFWMIYHK